MKTSNYITLILILVLLLSPVASKTNTTGYTTVITASSTNGLDKLRLRVITTQDNLETNQDTYLLDLNENKLKIDDNTFENTDDKLFLHENSKAYSTDVNFTQNTLNLYVYSNASEENIVFNHTVEDVTDISSYNIYNSGFKIYFAMSYQQEQGELSINNTHLTNQVFIYDSTTNRLDPVITLQNTYQETEIRLWWTNGMDFIQVSEGMYNYWEVESSDHEKIGTHYWYTMQDNNTTKLGSYNEDAGDFVIDSSRLFVLINQDTVTEYHIFDDTIEQYKLNLSELPDDNDWLLPAFSGLFLALISILIYRSYKK